ncbi:mitochondrial K+-H+ exchange-related-domain-containing protein [Gongronella butleri]|nr:mitochondrial K+-H+ exchange-related-domain-containing protein [Gongronella butleri]
MKFLAVPIVKNRLAFYCHSTSPTVSRITQLVDWSNKKWSELGQAKPETWKKRLYDKGDDILKRQDYREVFLKEIPTKEHLASPIEKATLVHALDISPEVIQHDLRRLVQERLPYHKKYMYRSAYWVPVACTFAIVPLIPNIPLAYNLFRLYSHYKAYKGAQHLHDLLENGQIQYKEVQGVPVETLASPETLEFPKSLVDEYRASAKLHYHDFDTEIPGVLSKTTIQHLAAQHPELPSLETEVMRTRNQMLYAIFKDRMK